MSCSDPKFLHSKLELSAPHTSDLSVSDRTLLGSHQPGQEGGPWWDMTRGTLPSQPHTPGWCSGEPAVEVCGPQVQGCAPLCMLDSGPDKLCPKEREFLVLAAWKKAGEGFQSAGTASIKG